MLKRHVRLRFQSDAGAENVRQRPALLGQGIDDGRARGRERGFEHVAQNGENAVERLVFVRVGMRGAPLNAGHHLSDEHEVDDEGGGEEGVFADVEDAVLIAPRVSTMPNMPKARAPKRVRGETYEIV